MRPAATFSEAQIPRHNLLGQVVCSVGQLLALAPARLKEQQAVGFSAAVPLRLKPKQSQPLVDSVDSELLVPALGEQQEELQEACCK